MAQESSDDLGLQIDLETSDLKLGEREKAIVLLEYYANGKGPPVVYIKATPEFERIRTDPRFISILQPIGLLTF